MKPSVLVIATLSALLSACGGGEDNAPLAIPDYRVDVALPTAGTLCADLDQNWQCDPADPAVSGEGAVALVSRSANIVNSPLLFVPRSGGLLLAHPAAKGDPQRLQPTLLSTLWQSRIAEGVAADRALAQLLADLAPLQPGSDRAALAGLGQFDQALQQVAISLQQQARARLANAKETQLLTTSYRAISLMLEQLAQEWQRNGQFAEETQSELLTLLVQQQPRNLLTVTGVTTFSDGNDPLLEQEPDDYPGQDASWNRTRPQLAYRKLDDRGQILPDNAPSWQCVKDLNTGLVWEVKSDDPLSPAWKSRPFAYEDEQFKATAGEQQAAYQHIHKRIEQLTAEGDLAALARAQALTSMLTTRAYQQWLNGEQHCGISQWRLPTMGELMSLMHYGSLAKDPLGQRIIVDTRYFPDIASSEDDTYHGYYWSATSNTAQRFSGGPISKRTVLLLGEDAGTTYPALVQQDTYIELMQVRLVATPQ
ncbi:DUF1566 domain-containing protein [Aeromonas veronii]|uniref:Lcl C-terminal domain-containing protein n=1 Tax=Aeromonas TaxID=642 RepID=UPI0027DABBF9|nr:DUF1566 domain-containing protein [Aeromonas veronii]EKP0310998.1 DUF1566 domain-containing protein [Aeromonas veronii]WMJ06705.1 DUF1566 domain-containing protein [Aeromonas veronii]